MSNILTVDDNDAMRRMISHTLCLGGYVVAEAPSAQDALDKMENQSFDLIITDMNMPNMNGIEFTKAIRQLNNHRTVPVLILSTENKESLKKNASTAGANGWIVKPFSPTDLIDKVRSVIH
ncbi:MAG: response regulator [Saccharospirillaceae bacterium]|nr:response regulator [Pseudomonadales bacterium]NRB78791.1 response regulator [Saccharospirillaceae bacterium]